MRNPSFAVGLLMVFSAIAMAEPATQPVMPVDQIPVPAPRGSAVAIAPPAALVEIAPAGTKLVILPFESLGNADRRDWVVRALQESFSTEGARLGGLFIYSAPAPAGQQIDTTVARDVAKTYGGDFVIFGSCQFVESRMRITGQIINVKTGESVTGLKASGDMRDLFSLEDQLTGEMSRALRPPKAEVAQAKPNQVFAQVAPPLTADELFPPPVSTVANADAYNRYYYQPYGSYGYGGYGTYFYPGFGYPSFFPGAIGFYPNGLHTGWDNHHRRDADVGNNPYRGAN